MYILILSSNFIFFLNYRTFSSFTVCEKNKVARKNENVHQSTQFFTVIPNMIFLLHKSLVVMEKTKNYGENSYFFAPHSEKMTFLRDKKGIFEKALYRFENTHLADLTMQKYWL